MLFARYHELLAEITHTEKDTLEIIDPSKLIENAERLAEIIYMLNHDFIEDRLSTHV